MFSFFLYNRRRGLPDSNSVQFITIDNFVISSFLLLLKTIFLNPIISPLFFLKQPLSNNVIKKTKPESGEMTTLTIITKMIVNLEVPIEMLYLIIYNEITERISEFQTSQ